MDASLAPSITFVSSMRHPLMLLFLLNALLLPNALAYSLQGKRALVTGSSGGIGRGIALELAEQGCEVLVHYHVREDGARETMQRIVDNGGVCAGAMQCDFRDRAAIDKFLSIVDDVWEDGLDILVNNAGVVHKLALEDDDNLQLWEETMAVNLHAPYRIGRWAAQRMTDRQSKASGVGGGVGGGLSRGGGGVGGDSGVIINVSSMHGDRSVQYMGAYAASKAALDSLTRSMAMEWAPNVRVNAIAPGPVIVERNVEAITSLQREWQERIPAGILGTVQQVVDAVLPLITNEWVTGSVWVIDGGLTARNNMPDRPRPMKIHREKPSVAAAATKSA